MNGPGLGTQSDAEIDSELEVLKAQYDKVERNRLLPVCLFGGGFLLFGGLLPLMPHDYDVTKITIEQWFLYIGALLFLYGFMMARRGSRLGNQIKLCWLVKMLKQTETDNRLMLSTDLDGYDVVLHVHDKEKGPRQRCWVNRLSVSDYWGDIHLYGDFYGGAQPSYRWRKAQERI